MSPFSVLRGHTWVDTCRDSRLPHPVEQAEGQKLFILLAKIFILLQAII